ncbi:SDR family oxidoreductase [Sphingomonas sanxanigenens]|uniref:Saccharopine dehydrogenase NADP binding domain-containing protein n=1 Tax=Sphingomonas sanxanigenens DSM 19645 = NX02 TaxID=1123269 RepID=W0AN85_9SPHN|nr:DUF4166 domain-containing protein [Sphingomonas sanxanigenens]AHE57160.1 hypothetical protein NX02_27885 [Sphingomonas sanxanigenens DSM 19645 = NX02]
MSRILIIGGYGGFGARLARRLAARGHRLIVAGRSLDGARRFCATLEGAEPARIDRADIGGALAALRPDLVIDAAGPFQASGYAAPRACIAAAIPYVDLADARGFVAGIGALDAAARAAGVAVVTGASSVPALSGAAVRAITHDMAAVRSVEMAITASNRAGAGPSVTRAVLSYAGQALPLWRGRRWTTGFGWQEMRRARFTIAGRPPLDRWVALADVPDLALMPSALPGQPAVTFRAGTELGFQNLVLWAASWPVRWHWIAGLGRAAPWLSRLQRLTVRLGGTRSAMRVAARGRRPEGDVERCWTLLADHGDGPEIPTLAAVLVAEAILDGRIASGAVDASRLLALADFAPLFAELAVEQDIVERPLPPPLYRRVLGAGFDRLPPLVAAMHDICADDGAAGEAHVARGRGPLAALAAAIMRFPPAGDHDLHMAFAADDRGERWTRRFGRHGFSSRMTARKGLLIERFGPLRFGFQLAADAEGLAMHLRRWSIAGLPLPLALAPRLSGREWQEGDRFRFEVDAALPLVGRVLRYEGWLRPSTAQP